MISCPKKIKLTNLLSFDTLYVNTRNIGIDSLYFKILLLTTQSEFDIDKEAVGAYSVLTGSEGCQLVRFF